MKLEEFFSVDKEPMPDDAKLVGFFDSPQTIAELNLMAAAMGMDRSKLLRKIISEWLESNDALEKAVEKMKELRSNKELQEMTVTEFKGKIKVFLIERKVTNHLIEKVLRSI